MTKEQCIQSIMDTGVVGIIRVNSAEELVNICLALNKGGVKAIEITMTSPEALEAIREAKKRLGDEAIIGAGTVLDSESGRAVIMTGAKFIVGPTFNLDLAKLCRRYGVAYIPGAFTPNEILNAWENGADVVKVFPITQHGPTYIKDILGPLPNIRLTPTGGITLGNIGNFMKAGACFVGVGGALVNKQLIKEKKWDELSVLAGQFIEAVKKSRS